MFTMFVWVTIVSYVCVGAVCAGLCVWCTSQDDKQLYVTIRQTIVGQATHKVKYSRTA